MVRTTDHFSTAVFDVDGTLTDATGGFDREAIGLIAQIAGGGVEVIIATARGPTGLSSLVDMMDSDIRAITYQGALIGRFEERRWIGETGMTISLEVAHEIAALAAGEGVPTSWHTGESWWVTELTAELAREAGIVGESPELVADHRGIVAPPHKLMFVSPVGDTAALERFRRSLPPSVSHAYSHHNYLEVSPHGATKGHALRRLRNRAGRIIAFGDGENDIPMFEVADYAVAMAHASATVRQAADTVAVDGLTALLTGIQWESYES